MEFIESKKLVLDSGAVVWTKDVEVYPQDFNDVLRSGWDPYSPRLIIETIGGVRHEALLVNQTRDVLTEQLEAWLTRDEARSVIDRFGIGFHSELDGEVIPKFYTLRK